MAERRAVSSVTRELASAGARVSFEDRGVHRLKGIADERRIYALSAAPK